MRKIFHVGLMKSGTTYIQEILSANREFLNRNGWDYPGKRLNQQHACYSVCGKDIPWVRRSFPKNLGEDLVARSAAAQKNLLVSAEALSVLDDEAIQRFLKVMGKPEKVIFTIRGLVKVLPSAWQQYLKGGGQVTLKTFVERLQGERKDLSGFWRTYAYGHAIERWSRYVDVETIIVPVKRERGDELWQLFRSACDLPEVPSLDVPAEKANVSLTLEVAQILRHLNKKIPETSAENDKVRAEYLHNAVFPFAGNGKGTRIELPRQALGVVERWNQEESELLLKFSNRIHGQKEDLFESVSTSAGKTLSSAKIADTAAEQVLALLRRG